MHITQGVFRHDAVLVLAKKQPDGLIVSCPAKDVIHRRTIEVQLTDIFGLELSRFNSTTKYLCINALHINISI